MNALRYAFFRDSLVNQFSEEEVTFAEVALLPKVVSTDFMYYANLVALLDTRRMLLGIGDFIHANVLRADYRLPRRHVDSQCIVVGGLTTRPLFVFGKSNGNDLQIAKTGTYVPLSRILLAEYHGLNVIDMGNKFAVGRHLCGNALCVNVHHISPGTYQANANDIKWHQEHDLATGLYLREGPEFI